MSGLDKVYVVDDDSFFLKMLEQVFRSAGFEVHAFSSAREFLAAPLCEQDTCLILDLRMPDMGGVELLRRLRERGSDMPVIVYSGNADLDVAVRVMRDGAYSVIQKPFSNELLIEQVRQAIAATRRVRTRGARIRDAQAALALLSERERSVARALADGLSAREVGELLGLSARTVEAHRANIFRKLNINTSAILVRMVVLAEVCGD